MKREENRKKKKPKINNFKMVSDYVAPPPPPPPPTLSFCNWQTQILQLCWTQGIYSPPGILPRILLQSQNSAGPCMEYNWNSILIIMPCK